MVKPLRGARVLIIAATIIAVVWTAVAGLTPHVGLFHDDGIYAVTAKAVAEGRGYRLDSVVSTPAQTKYPPLYPLLLSVVWRLGPAFPQNAYLLKVVSVAALGVTLLASLVLLGQVVKGPPLLIEIALVVGVGLNPLSLSLVDVTLSDHLFAAIVALCLIAHTSGDQEPRSVARVLVSSVLAILAMATRTVGAAAVAAGLIWAMRRGRRTALVYAAPLIAYLAVGTLAISPTPALNNPLLEYYTGYEHRALLALATAPWRAVKVAADNIVYSVRAVDLLVLLNVIPGFGWVSAGLVMLGSPAMFRRAGVFAALFILMYAAVVLLYPFRPTRYLLPLVPVLIVCWIQGATVTFETLGRGFRQPLAAALYVVMQLPLALSCAACLLWAIGNVRAAQGPWVRLWFGLRSTYEWSGFAETIAWVKNNTRVHDVLATPYDPMYFLYTNRRGIRPWIHRPETYFYPRGNATADIGDARAIRAALDDVGATFLIQDPLDGYAEASAVAALYPLLLAEYGAAAQLVFESSDRRHRVYKLPPAAGNRQ